MTEGEAREDRRKENKLSDIAIEVERRKEDIAFFRNKASCLKPALNSDKCKHIQESFRNAHRDEFETRISALKMEKVQISMGKLSSTRGMVENGGFFYDMYLILKSVLWF